MSYAHAIPSGPFAPWAEIVPGAPRATAQSLLAREDDGWQYEVIEEDFLVDVWHRGDPTPAPLRAGDTLDGENVVFGFTYAVAKLFA